MYKPAPLLVGIAVLAGCSLAPRYQRPTAPIAAAYSATNRTSDSAIPAADLAWSQFYGDIRLQRVIRLALDNNRDLRVAALNVERVRALYDIQRTALIPSVNAKGEGFRGRTPGDLSPTGAALVSSSYSAGLELPSYELDFFGKVTSLKHEVLEQYLATDEARVSAQIGVISSVARQYLALQATDEQLALARQTQSAAEASYRLTRQSYEAGVVSELDLRTAEENQSTLQAAVASLVQQRARAENALVFLIGTPLPADLPAASSLLGQPMIEDLPAGLPSELLDRRPDIRAAEHNLMAANANIGLARAAFFPSVKLTAFDGSASAELSGLFKSGSSQWSFAPSVSLPIFAAGRNVAQLKVAKVDQRIALANYDKAIQNAFREVSDALAAREPIKSQIQAQEARVNAAQRRYDLTLQRYQGGVDSFLSVLLAQQELYSAQQALIDARLARLTNLTNLYAALGGGWQGMPKNGKN